MPEVAVRLPAPILIHPIPMRPLLPVTVALSLSAFVAHAEEKAKGRPIPFPGLATFVISGGDAPLPEQISYDASLSKVINKPLDAEGKEDITRVLSTRLNRENDARCFVDFDPGPSADPQFLLTDEKTGTEVGRIGADALILPGNGFIYSIARTNNMHEERQKFAVRDGKLVEVKQPFSYVGLESKAKVPLTLTAAKGSGETVASIPKGDALQVVLRDDEYLLVKTQFGLVGWWKMKTDVLAGNEEIEGIYFAGD